MGKRINTAVMRMCLVITLILSICLCFINSPVISADDLGGYFQINYDPAAFSKTTLVGNEAFTVTIQGNATCTQEPPVHPTKGRMTGNITAVHSVNGHQVILQPSYTVDIEPFPSYPGESVNMTVTVTLQFPAHGEAGQYSIIAKTISAEVYKYGWLDVTDMVPPSKDLGTVNYTPAAVTPIATTSDPGETPGDTPAATATATVTPVPTPTTSPTPTTIPAITPTPATGPGTSTGSGLGVLPQLIAVGIVAIVLAAILVFAVKKRRTPSQR